MSGNYIHDGYTCDGYLDGVSRLHDPVQFKYRPLKYDEREAVAQKVRSEAPAAQGYPTACATPRASPTPSSRRT